MVGSPWDVEAAGRRQAAAREGVGVSACVLPFPAAPRASVPSVPTDRWPAGDWDVGVRGE